MNKPKELFVWANPDKTISVSLGTIETEVKMTLEEAKEKFSGAIRAAEEMSPSTSGK
jgi:anti-sigma-K factor RskA